MRRFAILVVVLLSTALQVSANAISASSLLPELGPYGSFAVLFSPEEHSGINESHGADYLRADGRRIGAMFAGEIGSNHSADNISAWFSEGEVVHRSNRFLSGSIFDVLEVARDDGSVVYAISYTACDGGSNAIVNGSSPYTLPENDSATQVVAWGESEDVAALLVTASLELLATNQSVGFASEAPALPEISDQALVYPNPATVSTSISLNLSTEAPTELGLYDLLGRHISTIVSSDLERGLHTFSIDVSALPAGVYVVRAVIDGRISTTRFTQLG